MINIHLANIYKVSVFLLLLNISGFWKYFLSGGVTLCCHSLPSPLALFCLSLLSLSKKRQCFSLPLFSSLHSSSPNYVSELQEQQSVPSQSSSRKLRPPSDPRHCLAQQQEQPQPPAGPWTLLGWTDGGQKEPSSPPADLHYRRTRTFFLFPLWTFTGRDSLPPSVFIDLFIETFDYLFAFFGLCQRFWCIYDWNVSFFFFNLWTLLLVFFSFLEINVLHWRGGRDEWEELSLQAL